LPKLEKKLEVPKTKLIFLLNKLLFQIYKKKFYQDKMKKAAKMVGHIDKKDVEILALALKLETYLWSQDKDFEKCGYQKILKTYNFID